MHLLAAQAGAIQQEGEAIDLGQSPGRMVFASAADSELMMLAAAADRAGKDGLRLANTLRLAHNLSVDLWLEATVRHARLVVVRLLGGASYWQYGVDELTAVCATAKIPLALLPGDVNPDPILRERSTVRPEDWTRLHGLFTAGGPENADALLLAFELLADAPSSGAARHLLPPGEKGSSAPGEPSSPPSPPVGEGVQGAGEGVLAALQPKPFARFGLWHPALGITDEADLRAHLTALESPSPLWGGARGGGEPSTQIPQPDLPTNGRTSYRAFIPILFYRAALEGAGTATLEALIAALEKAGLAPVPLLVSSLKEAPCVRFVQNAFAAFPPEVVLNLTGFALGINDLDAKANPFADINAPVIQLLQGGRPAEQWAADKQGLTAKDLAMQIVLPELDGRIGDILVGHKQDAVWHARTQCPLSAYAPDAEGIARAVALAENYVRLRRTPRPERKVAIVLANYPIRDGRIANGVGYDAPQSTVEILQVLAGAGYTLGRRDENQGSTPTPNPSPQGGGEAAAPQADMLEALSPPSPLRGGVGGGGAAAAARKYAGAGHNNARHARLPKNITLARRLRSNTTTPEQIVWRMLRKIDGVHFRRQVPIGPYFADFASHAEKLVIELDGDTHFSGDGPARDVTRTAFLEGAGYRVLRFTNSEVGDNLEGIWEVVVSALAAGAVTPTPDPSPQGGGGAAAPRLKADAEATFPSPLRRGVRGRGHPADGNALIEALQAGPTNADPQRGRSPAPLHLARYAELFATLPAKIQAEISTRWGAPETDPFVRDGAFQLPVLHCGNVAIVLQPARGYDRDDTANYHDPDLVPPHAYLAAYLWIRHEFGAHTLIHNGKHGNLEWLPGKATALDGASYPAALWGQLPHFYPFIVNDPGEGTQAKRRTGATIIDHLVPPLTRAGTYGPLKDLEALFEEYYAASGMDRRRLADLKRRILDFARDARLDRDVALPADGDAALAEIDNFLCELKEAQIRDGLHIFGQSPKGTLERDLVVALARVPRGGDGGGDASLIRALADDLKLGLDPLTARLGDAWSGAHPPELTGPMRTVGDVVEALEGLAAELVSGRAAEPDWVATSAVLETVETVIRPRLKASGPSEIQALLDGLDGKFVAPGPSGAPSRGRLDVLPTGRNFYSVDNRAVPTPTAWELGRKSAENVLVRHFQDHGVYLQSLALSVWGTANMRTGGDDIAQALAFIGARPVWEPSSLRVSGYEIIPLAKLGRPRVDVTLRISGFFRDAFPAQIALFDRAIRAIGALDEPEDQNPIAARMRTDALGLMAQGQSEAAAALGAGHRIFGSKPGAYGAGLQGLIDSGKWEGKANLADAFLNWGQYAYGAQAAGIPERDRFAARLSAIDAVVHNQDNREHDLLDSDDYYQFEGGLSATAETLSGSKPAAYHNDHSRPERPLTRTLTEEVSRVMRSRVVNPKWIAGVMRHGYKGAFEIIATVDYMFAFAATTGAVQTHHFDLAFEAFVEDGAVRDFIRANNRYGYAELIAKFNEAIRRGLWTPRSNSAYALLEETLS